MSIVDVNHVVYPAVDVSRIQTAPYTHIVGPSFVNSYIAPQTSAANNNSSEFTIRFNDKKTAVDPSSLIVHLPITITKVGALGAGNNPYNAPTEGFCANPLEKLTNTLKIKIDGSVINYNLRDIIYGTECLDEVKLDNQETGDLKMIDMCQSYPQLFGTNSSPYALPADNVVQSNRRSFPITATYDGVNTTVITTTLVFNLGKYAPFNTKQLYPLASDEITLTFEYNSGMLARMWRVDGTNHPQPAIVPTFTLGQGELRYVLNQLPAGMETPRHERYMFTKYIGRTPNTTGVIAAGDQFVVQSGVNELSQVPKLIIVYLKRAESTFTTALIQMQTADYFARIENVAVQLGNRTGVFNAMSQKQLHELSRKRGLSCDFSLGQWVGTQGAEVASLALGSTATGKGSVFVFSPILDIGGSGNDFLTNGVTQKNVFSINITARNLQNAGTAFDLNVIEVYDSMIVVNDNMSTIYDVVSSSTDVVASSQRIEYPDEELRGGSIGSFFKGLWNKGKQLFNTLSPILKSTKILSKGAKLLPFVGSPASSILDQLGYGDGGYMASQSAGGVVGGRRTNKKKN